jgi:hypothetical protein
VAAINDVANVTGESRILEQDRRDFLDTFRSPSDKSRDAIGRTLFLLAGCSMPVILRPHSTAQGAFTVVGHAYVDTMMDGEL